MSFDLLLQVAAVGLFWTSGFLSGSWVTRRFYRRRIALTIMDALRHAIGASIQTEAATNTPEVRLEPGEAIEREVELPVVFARRK